MGIFSRLFKKSSPAPAAETPSLPVPERYPFTRWYTYGNHMYRTATERADVEFVNEATGKRVLLVDNDGYIQNFPGIVKGDWTKLLTTQKNLKPQIRFRSEFSKISDDRYMMLWQVQPDGRYWADDDGFGMENDVEIHLYAYIDKDGNFEAPFRIYEW
ncbi:MAG: hypothetical protein E7430_05280 [Ruminococcaceae bacterium]|nr:hypothetical protein [Oscillospiraceae bacterium]